MSRPARVLITDDAVVVRRLVSDVLGAVPTIEVVGTAPNGRIAIQKIPQLAPDIVILDVEMPDMDGIETLTAIRAEHPRLPVVMFSTLTERGAAITLEALMRGANDYVTKPANVGSVAEAMERVREELVPRIHALCGIAEPAAPSPATPCPSSTSTSTSGPVPARPAAPMRAVTAPAGPASRVDLVVIGVSTGGPNALAELMPALPGDLPVPVVIVQHMPPMFTRLLAERLDAHSSLAVREATGGESIGAGQCWIAPGDHHLEVAGSGTGGYHLRLNDGPRENSCRPAVDVLFRSAAATSGRHTLGVVLTGMGRDGCRGSGDLAAEGAHLIAQDEATSVVWGMPGAVVEAGLATEVLPLDKVAAAITARVALGRVGPVHAASGVAR